MKMGAALPQVLPCDSREADSRKRSITFRPPVCPSNFQVLLLFADSVGYHPAMLDHSLQDSLSFNPG